MGITRLEFQIDATGNCILCKSRRSTTVNRNLPYRIQHELRQIVLLEPQPQPQLDQQQQQPHDEQTTTRRITFDEFCDQIDETLLPLEDLKRKNVRTSCILMGLAFALIASHHTIQALRNNNSENENENENTNTNESSSFMPSMFGNLPNIILSLLFIIIPFVAICYISRTAQKGETNIFSKISDICDQISANSEQVQFTLRYRSDEKHSRIVKYIEVKMLNSSAESLLEEGQGPGQGPGPGRRRRMGPSRPGTPETVISYESSLPEDD